MAFLYWVYFIIFILACLCAPFLLIGFIINLFAKNKKISIITMVSLVLCVVIFISYASPDYSKANFSDSTVKDVLKVVDTLDNDGFWEKFPEGNNQYSYTCHWITDTTHITVHVYPQTATLLNTEKELYVDRTADFLLFGKEEKTKNMHLVIYPRVIYRDFLQVVPDYSETEIEILNEGRVFDVTMLNKTWEKKDDVSINEFFSDLFNDTNNGEFLAGQTDY